MRRIFLSAVVFAVFANAPAYADVPFVAQSSQVEKPAWLGKMEIT